MLGRRTVALAAVFAFSAAGCTTITPEASVAPTTSASTAPPAAPSAVATVEPSLTLPSVPPSVDLGTPAPSKTPKPPRATPSAGSSLPNLVISKFVSEANPFIAGVDTKGRVTIKNIGGADAGSFTVGDSYALDNGQGIGGYSGIPVDGLAAGDSVQVEVDITEPDVTAVTWTAEVDTDNVIAESNEDDNKAFLRLSALPAVANLVIDTFTIQPNFANPGTYTVDWVIHNVGTADVDQEIVIETDWYADGVGSGSLPGQSRSEEHTSELQSH